jgi:hypothetical protein
MNPQLPPFCFLSSPFFFVWGGGGGGGGGEREREGRVLKKTLQNLDKYSVTMDRFGGWVTAPIKRTIFGCRRRFIIAT